MRFRDRVDAGRQLAAALRGISLHEPVVLALPRGGVPVAAEVASALGAPLEVFVARKIGAPAQPELGIGAVAETPPGADDTEVIDQHLVSALRIAPDSLRALAASARDELDRRVVAYRGGRALPDLEDRDVVLVDDGLATGVTAEAALRALRHHRPRRLILAAPVCAPPTGQRLAAIADEVVCLHQPVDFRAVGPWYDDFTQTSDEEVLALLGPR